MSTELKIALFLGAGASVPYNKPTTRQLKNDLIKKYPYSNTAQADPAHFYLNSIINFKYFDDIEHVLQCIKEIDDFFNGSQYGAKYLTKRDFKLVFNEMYGAAEINLLLDNIKSLRTKIEDDVFEKYSWDHSTDQTMIRILGGLIRILKEKSPDVHIFTTNYDRAVEEYCSDRERKCRCIDGFNTDDFSGRRLWSGEYSFPSGENITNVFLYKLHGSLNWKRHKQYGIEKTSEERRSSDSNYIENLLVYPTVSPKDEINPEPYSKILDEFKKFFEKADVCIVIGYSFRDEHINTVLSDFMKRGKRLIIISPSADNDWYGNLIKQEISGAEGTTVLEEDDEFFANVREKHKVFTLNQPIEPENSDKVFKMISQIMNIFSNE